MEITSEENSLPLPNSSNDVAHDTEKLEPNISDHGAEDVDPLYIMDFVQPKSTEEVEPPHTIMDFVEPKFTEEVGPHTIMDFVEPKFTEEVEQHTIMDFVEPKFTEVEVRSILEVIAATGRFWHGWDLLKNLLSFQMKQVLSEYPEAQVVGDQQFSSLVEPYPELVKRLDEALQSFIEGPPFTLQRLCEILLAARSIYPNLSKLALALEKNLLVTSTLTISTDPYPSTMTHKLDEDEPEKESSAPPVHTDPVQNGVETMVHDEDEEMADAEETEEENKTINRETAEETNSGTSETSSDQSTGSEPSGDSSPSSEPLNPTT